MIFELASSGEPRGVSQLDPKFLEQLRLERALGYIQRISWWMDAAWRVPGTRFRVGYDAVLGLIPGVGDLMGVTVTLYLIIEASRLGIGVRPIAKMLGNAAIEATVGSVPLLGDLFDAGFKANLRNLRILEAALRDRVDRGAAST